MAVEKGRHDEVQKRPQFLHAVLDRRSRQEQAVPAIKAQKGLPPGRGRTLDCLSFVKDHVLPFDPPEMLLIAHDQLVTGDKHVERRVFRIQFLLIPEFAEDFAILLIAPVRQCFQLRGKAGHFLLPIVESGSRGDDEERAPDVMSFRKVSHERY